jgi:hypothetical protein
LIIPRSELPVLFPTEAEISQRLPNTLGGLIWFFRRRVPNEYGSLFLSMIDQLAELNPETGVYSDRALRASQLTKAEFGEAAE